MRTVLALLPALAALAALLPRPDPPAGSAEPGTVLDAPPAAAPTPGQPNLQVVPEPPAKEEKPAPAEEKPKEKPAPRRAGRDALDTQ